MEAEKIVIHAGSFHSDDVMCVALAEIAFPGIEVQRVFHVPENIKNDDKVIIADIGFGKYDHHQPDARRRENGEKYAACGLVFEDIWDRIFPDEESAERFIKDYIIPIESADNGVRHDPLSTAVNALNPLWNEPADFEEGFRTAVDSFKIIIRREVKRANAELDARKIVEDALAESENGLVILPQYVIWDTILPPTDAKYVVYPSRRGGFNVQAVPVSAGSFRCKTPLPEEWLTEPPEGCMFVHAARFMASFNEMENAVAAARSLFSE